MIVLLAFAFLSGLVTILSPCILPVLPIVLSGSLGGGKAKPFGVISGFILSFTFFTLALTAVVQALGIAPDAMRWVAVALIALFGLVLLVPPLAKYFELATARLGSLFQGQRPAIAMPLARQSRLKGYWSGLGIGLSLGLVWTPCVGPIMASVISLALTKHLDGGSVLITLAYSLGTALPMLLIMLGGRALLERLPVLRRRAAGIQRIFGAFMILIAIGIGLGWDRSVQAAILSAFPDYGSGLTSLEQVAPVQGALQERRATAGQAANALGGQFAGAGDGPPPELSGADLGRAPALAGGGRWFNLSANQSSLRMDELRGKVVLVDFWTYSCVNCVRTLPFLRAWYERYKDKGFVIIGVHSPEFEFEKNPGNLQSAMHSLGVDWPVVQDNDYAIWNAYANKYWPAHYLIDAQGRVRTYRFGEGGYDKTEAEIRSLLAENGAALPAAAAKAEPVLASQTPETYLGFERGHGLVSAVNPVAGQAVDFQGGKKPGNGEWTLGGRWTMNGEYIESSTGGSLEFGFMAKDVFLVVEAAGTGGSITCTVDGQAAGDTQDAKSGVVRIDQSRLYHLVKLPAAGSHVLNLRFTGKLRLFAFTFG